MKNNPVEKETGYHPKIRDYCTGLKSLNDEVIADFEPFFAEKAKQTRKLGLVVKESVPITEDSVFKRFLKLGIKSEDILKDCEDALKVL